MIQKFIILTVFAVLCVKLVIGNDAKEPHSMIEEETVFDKSLATCLQKNPKLKKEKVMQVIQAVFDGEVDQDMKCMLHCIGTEMGEMNDDGTVNVEKSVEKVPKNINKDVVKKIGEECVVTKGTDKCDTAFKQFKCITEHALAKKGELMQN